MEDEQARFLGSPGGDDDPEQLGKAGVEDGVDLDGTVQESWSAISNLVSVDGWTGEESTRGTNFDSRPFASPAPPPTLWLSTDDDVSLLLAWEEHALARDPEDPDEEGCGQDLLDRWPVGGVRAGQAGQARLLEELEQG